MIKGFAIFEGGGAKGLAHVGALKVLEENGIELVAVAGTSAGAIVAALVSAGYSPNELFDSNSETTETVFKKDFVSLIGRGKWSALTMIWKIAKAFYRARFVILACGLLLAVTLCYLGTLLDAVEKLVWTLGIVALTVLFALIVSNWIPISGIFSTAAIEEWLREKLSSCVFDGDPSKTVLFEDLKIPLTIVATDLNKRKLIEFNRRNTPNFSVATAVAGSISIPFAFRPVAKDDYLLVDGGILSNFPAWALDDDAAVTSQSEVVPTFGFRLRSRQRVLGASGTREITRTRLARYAFGLLRTAFLSENILEARQVLDLSEVPLQVSVDTLDFDLSYEKKRDLFREGYFSAAKFYRDVYIGPKHPGPIDAILEFLESNIRDLIRKPDTHLRINVALPIEPQRRKLRILYRRNMEEDTDDNFVLGLDEGAIGRCWQSNGKSILVETHKVDPTFLKEWKMTKYQQALVRPTIKTLLSVPIFEPNRSIDLKNSGDDNRMLAVLSIDSDCYLKREFDPIADSDSELSLLIKEVVQDIALELRS